jgi:hypothetical protein
VVDAEQQEEKAEPVKIAPKTKPPAKIEGKEGPWQLKITTDDSGDMADWIDAVKKAVGIMLQHAKDERDVMDIFKVNRTIFDRLKADAADAYAAMMADFSAAKNGFKKEQA